MLLHAVCIMTFDSLTPSKTIRIIIILGGSYGGLSTAHYLIKHVIQSLPEKELYEVIIVSASSQALCRPACPRAMISGKMFAQGKLFVSISKSFGKYSNSSFRFIHGTAMELDHINRTVSVNLAIGGTKKHKFYALVIATGASTPSPLLSLNRDEDFLRTKWAEFRKALKTAKKIVISGGGPSSVEIAGELGEYLNGRAGWFSPKPSHPNVTITLVTASSQILPALRPAIAKKAEVFLAQVGVTVIKNARVKSVAPVWSGD
jgi:NADH dehydrogenase FAD-containing subunit